MKINFLFWRPTKTLRMRDGANKPFKPLNPFGDCRVCDDVKADFYGSPRSASPTPSHGERAAPAPSHGDGPSTSSSRHDPFLNENNPSLIDSGVSSSNSGVSSPNSGVSMGGGAPRPKRGRSASPDSEACDGASPSKRRRIDHELNDKNDSTGRADGSAGEASDNASEASASVSKSLNNAVETHLSPEGLPLTPSETCSSPRSSIDSSLSYWSNSTNEV